MKLYMEQEKTYLVKVAFGTRMTNKAVYNEKWFKTVKPDGNEIVEKNFNSIEEANAFIEGIELMNGWMDECHMIFESTNASAY